MSNVVRFPGGHRVAARAIPRQEFERLAELALDVVERIVTLLDNEGGDDAVPSIGEVGGRVLLHPRFRGSDRDGELDG